MPALPDHLRIATAGVAPDASIVRAQRSRITVLTSRLLRLEWSPSGEFEDRATQVVINRDLPTPAYDVVRSGDRISVRTEHLRLDYDGGPFTPEGLSVSVLGGISSYHSTWHYGQADDPASWWRNLGGTARTLDGVDGATPLEPGVVSSTGYAILDDSRSLALTPDGWLATRNADAIDLYVFAHGHDAAAAVRDFYAITGPQPLLPRYALGNWWSRYHPYSDAEYRSLIERFEDEQIPFAVAVLDMDWHVTQVDPAIGSGWTGYSWNREFFPNPPEFLRWLHERGLRVTLNVHPADGIRRHEDAYPAVAEAMGVDPASGDPIPFDLTDERFRQAYLDLVHHPLEDEGVDFWWLDWQQGATSRLAGLDPLWLLNHLHFLDSARTGKRPITFSRYAGPGSHRYPVGFSGDTVVSWESLAFQPYFTATAANIGYGWWSHDIGGHMFGIKDDELATRWVQLGCFSPINRLHSTANPFNSKEPWRFNAIAERVQGEFLRLRHRLLPYLYTMNARAHAEGLPLVRPLYWADPPRAVDPDQTAFAFGSDLLVAPITTPADRATGLGAARAHLPEGTWLDVFTGVSYDGGRMVTFHRPLEGYPVLARAGAIVPLTGPGDFGVDNPRTLEIRVYAGASGTFELYEDDDAAQPRAVRTRMRFDWPTGTFVIEPARMDAPGIVPDRRGVTLVLVGAAAAEAEGHSSSWDPATASLTIPLGEVVTAEGVQVRFAKPLALADNAAVGRIWDLLDRAQIPFDIKDRAAAALRGADTPAGRLRLLLELGLEDNLRAPITELLLARL